MPKTSDILQMIEEDGIVAVLRSSSVDEAIEVARACIAGGIRLIEITFSVPGADAAIRQLKGMGVTVGTGTVLDDASARLAIDSGAEFIVSPSFDADVSEVCNLHNIPYIPGCMTVTEITNAMKHGSKMVKLFPANHFDLGFIKAIKAPLPQVKIMVTGGVSLSNAADWISAGAVAIGAAGNLTNVDKSLDNPFAKIQTDAAEYCRQIALGRKR